MNPRRYLIAASLALMVTVPGCTWVYWGVCAGGDYIGSVFNPDFKVAERRFQDATVGQPYSGSIGVTPQYQWLRIDDELPPGLELVMPQQSAFSYELVVRGTPTLPGNYAFEIEISGNLTMCTIDKTRFELELSVKPAQ